MDSIFNSDLSEHGKLIRIFLVSCSGDNKQASPSINTIAEKCSISRATVKRTLIELEHKGWITKTHRISQDGDFSSNIYTLHDGRASQ